MALVVALAAVHHFRDLHAPRDRCEIALAGLAQRCRRVFLLPRHPHPSPRRACLVFKKCSKCNRSRTVNFLRAKKSRKPLSNQGLRLFLARARARACTQRAQAPPRASSCCVCSMLLLSAPPHLEMDVRAPVHAVADALAAHELEVRVSFFEPFVAETVFHGLGEFFDFVHRELAV